MDGTIYIPTFVECSTKRVLYATLKVCSLIFDKFTFLKKRYSITCCIIHLKDIVQSPNFTMTQAIYLHCYSAYIDLLKE